MIVDLVGKKRNNMFTCQKALLNLQHQSGFYSSLLKETSFLLSNSIIMITMRSRQIFPNKKKLLD